MLFDSKVKRNDEIEDWITGDALDTAVSAVKSAELYAGAGEAANQCRCLPHEDDDLRFCADKECRHA